LISLFNGKTDLRGRYFFCTTLKTPSLFMCVDVELPQNTIARSLKEERKEKKKIIPKDRIKRSTFQI
jgi:hypothetical protein